MGATAKVSSGISAASAKVVPEPRDKTLDGMYPTFEKAETVLALLLEGSNISTI